MGTQWIKIKKSQDADSQMADTLDLIPIAAYWGKGKRANRFGAYLLAAYNKEFDRYEAICKIGTGFSDEFLDSMTKIHQMQAAPEKPLNYYVAKSLKPDVWLNASEVWEVQSDKLTLSPIYAVGKRIVDETKGLSLRFPRFIRHRTDKGINQSSTTSDIVDLYKRAVKDLSLIHI
eukprot:TRINITY_DN11464_c0_g1_i3.p1 TRINITY_DN11464_c0_g1~~TRINITY_DN11464_c0_g1_i3.p1  ORF type:complete len:175 (-),score=20.26 TRINITY_DN11464_c0_g1_i3:111-635(-)